MTNRVGPMLIKEFIQVFRDRRMRLVILVLPCIQMLVIGYAVTTDIRGVRTVVCDLDASESSRELTARFSRSGYFDIVERTDREERCRELIDHSQVSMALVFRHGFAEELRGGRTAELQMLLDGTDSNTAGVVIGYSRAIVAKYSQELLDARFMRSSGPMIRPRVVELEPRAWYNQNLESRNYFVPGVIVLVVSLVTLLLTSMAVVREKEIGTIEQILVTPIRPAEFVLGKTIPFALIGLVDVLIVTVVGVYWFEVPIHGSLLLLLFATGLYLMTTLGVGLLISTISGTQQQAMMSTFFFFFPAMWLSGFVFPIGNMPEIAQWVTLANPLRHFLIIVRAIFLKGVGASVLWPELVALAAMGLGTLWLVAWRFRKTS